MSGSSVPDDPLDAERSRLMAEQERLLRVGVPIEELAKLDDLRDLAARGHAPAVDDPFPSGSSVPEAARAAAMRANRWTNASGRGPEFAILCDDDQATVGRFMALADAEVAAAVAEERATTGRRIEAVERLGPLPKPSDDDRDPACAHDRGWVRGWNAALDAVREHEREHP